MSNEEEGLSRRRLLGTAGATVVAGAAGVGAFAVARQADKSLTVPNTLTPSSSTFHGEHQAGILTEVQNRMHFAAFDVVTDSRDDLIALLKAWTQAAVEMTSGELIGADETPRSYDSPPADTGEAVDLPASSLTITFGFGPTLFDKDGKDRFGLKARQPKGLQPLPHFAADKLDPQRSNGDICIQACANDPQVAVHAIHDLARIGIGTVSLRWAQLGFARAATTSTKQKTSRDLLGFKNGTANIKAEHPRDVSNFVWVAEGDDDTAPWMVGGAFLVARRINIHLNTWDASSLRDQEHVIGRDRKIGAPLSGGKEHTKSNFEAQGPHGPLIPANSHVRLTHPDFNNGTKLLRRSFNFTDGVDPLGQLDAGLFFLAYVRDVQHMYVPMQKTLDAHDALTKYVEHTGSALFAVPPGVAEGDKSDYIGRGLFI